MTAVKTVTRVTFLDRSARQVTAAGHPTLLYDFGDVFARVSHLPDVAKRIRECDGTVRDALLGDASFIAPEDLDGYFGEAVAYHERQLGRVIELHEREIDRARKDLDDWRAFIAGDAGDG